MAVTPRFLRRVRVSDLPDADWAATQVAPSVSICADVSTVKRMGVVLLVYTAAGVVVNPSGTVSVQVVDIAAAEAEPARGVATKTIIKASPADTLITAGTGLEYDVSGSRLVTIRLSAGALGGTVAYVEIWWNCIE